MAKKRTALHKTHVPTKWGIIIITVVALLMTLLVATQYNSPQNIFSNATADKGKIYSSIYPDKCVTAPNNSKSGDKVTIQVCKDGDPGQAWERSGGVVDRLYKNNGLCLATDKMATTDGTAVEVVSCGSGTNKAERWAEIDENGNKIKGGIFKLHGIDECLSADKFDVKVGNTFMISKCQNPLYKSQEWHFLQVGTSNGGNGTGNNTGNNPGGGSCPTNYIGTPPNCTLDCKSSNLTATEKLQCSLPKNPYRVDCGNGVYVPVGQKCPAPKCPVSEHWSGSACVCDTGTVYCATTNVCTSLNACPPATHTVCKQVLNGKICCKYTATNQLVTGSCY